MPKPRPVTQQRKRRVRIAKASPFPVPIATVTGESSSSSNWIYYEGTLGKTSVVVRHSGDMDFLYRMGFFGKGSLSRGQPQWAEHWQVASLPRTSSEGGGWQGVLRAKVTSRRRYMTHLKWQLTETGDVSTLIAAQQDQDYTLEQPSHHPHQHLCLSSGPCPNPISHESENMHIDKDKIADEPESLKAAKDKLHEMEDSEDVSMDSEMKVLPKLSADGGWSEGEGDGEFWDVENNQESVCAKKTQDDVLASWDCGEGDADFWGTDDANDVYNAGDVSAESNTVDDAGDKSNINSDNNLKSKRTIDVCAKSKTVDDSAGNSNTPHNTNAKSNSVSDANETSNTTGSTSHASAKSNTIHGKSTDSTCDSQQTCDNEKLESFAQTVDNADFGETGRTKMCDSSNVETSHDPDDNTNLQNSTENYVNITQSSNKTLICDSEKDCDIINVEKVKNHSENNTVLARSETVICDSSNAEKSCNLIANEQLQNCSEKNRGKGEKENNADLAQNETKTQWSEFCGDENVLTSDRALLFVIPNSDEEEEKADGQVCRSKTSWRPVVKSDPFPVHECLHLSLEEAYFLSYGLACLSVLDQKKTPMPLDRLWQACCRRQCDFLPNYIAYHYFRSKNWVPKTGLKFGCTFLLYKDGPPFYHGNYSVVVRFVDEAGHHVQGFGKQRTLSWTSLAGLKRITEHVGKELMVCYVIKPTDMTAEQMLSPACIPRFQVKEMLVSRWVSAQEREGKPLEDMP